MSNNAWSLIRATRRGATTIYNQYGTPIATLRRQYILKDGKRQACELEEARTEALILAAPELLETAERLLSAIEAFGDTIGFADRIAPLEIAIAKARGES